jgi:hypothetical protein
LPGDDRRNVRFYEPLGLTRFRELIRVERSGSVKGFGDGQERQAVFA